MPIALSDLLAVKPSPEIQRDATELVSRLADMEAEYQDLKKHDLGLLEGSNAIAFTRWPNGENINNFITYPDEELLKLVYKHGLYDIPNHEHKKEHEMSPGLNNSFIAWPSMLCFPGAIYTAINDPSESPHIRNIRFVSRNLPGAKYDPDKDQLTRELIEKAGFEYADAVNRAMFFALPGELYQNNLNIAMGPELRAHMMSLLLAKDLISNKGIEGYDGFGMSNYVAKAAMFLSQLDTLVGNDESLGSLISHFDTERERPVGKFVSEMLSRYIHYLENHPVARKRMNYFYRNIRTTTDGYDMIPFGTFPKKNPDEIPQIILKTYPGLSKAF